MKYSILLFLVLIYSTIALGQSFNNELPVIIRIKDDQGNVFVETTSNILFKYLDNNNDFKSCTLIHAILDKKIQSFIRGFSLNINPSNWEYIDVKKENIKAVYRNYCGLVYSLPNWKYGDPLNKTLKQETLLIYHKNGSIDFAIINFDKVNSIILTIE